MLAGVLGTYFSGNQGYALGTQAGFDAGYDDGYDAGFEDGYGRGFDAGNQTRLVPKITLTEQSYQVSYCEYDAGSNLYRARYTWSFRLVNTGEADGFAAVAFFFDSAEVGRVNYFVTAGSQISRTATVYGSGSSYYDCPVATTPGIAIVSVWKP